MRLCLPYYLITSALVQFGWANPLLGVAPVTRSALSSDEVSESLNASALHSFAKRATWPTGCVQVHCQYTQQKDPGLHDAVEITVWHNGELLFDLNGPGAGYAEWAGVRDKDNNQVC